jgi:histidine triad (HIT) family protein
LENNCIFCKIVAGEAPAEELYRDDLVTAFRDLYPVAPTHILIVPNKHYASLNDINGEDETTLGRLMTIARDLADSDGVSEAGYRLILNTGPHGGQVVYHLHLHLIGGRPMRHAIG